MISTDHKKISHKLKKRGWNSHYISKTIDIMKKAEKKRKTNIKVLDAIIYWTILIFVLVGNMIILVGVVPVIIEMPQFVVVLVLSLVGICFGFIIDTLIREINLSTQHYLFAGFLIPVIATINMLYVIEISKIIAGKIGIIIKLNPLLVVFFYILFFSIPHIIYKIKEKKEFLATKAM
jgi:hypothetical protein